MLNAVIKAAGASSQGALSQGRMDVHTQALCSPTSQGCGVLCSTVLLTLLHSSAQTTSRGRAEHFCLSPVQGLGDVSS